MNFANERILVTGATKGIGRATATLLAARGAKVVALGRNAAELESLAQEIGCECHACDLADAAATRALRAGNTNDEAAAAVRECALRRGFGDNFISLFIGHGVGIGANEPPYVGEDLPGAETVVLQAGMTFAIEPMINAGSPDIVVHDDGWSISTRDGSLSAHFEHTVAITAEGPRILTLSPVGASLLP